MTRIIVLLLVSLFSPAMAYSAWQDDLEAQFDIAETFDELQDWRGTAIRQVDYTKANMPVKTDGSDSMWDMYDYWSYTATDDDWIKDHGVDKVWGGTGKSLMLDLSQDVNAARKGPSRFGLYFGSATDGVADAYATSGTKDSGYSDFYYFYMVKFPSNHFPKDAEGQFIYYGYYKFNTYDCGFTSIGTPFNAAARHEYGPSHILNTWKTGSSYDYEMFMMYGYRVNAAADDSSLLYEAYAAVDNGSVGSSIKPYIDNNEWFGIEVHQTTGTPGNHDALTEIWLYDSNGDIRKTLTKTDGWVIEAGQTYSYNKFFFGGNQDFASEAGLDLTYVIDDFVMDSDRIGPTYFAMLTGAGPTRSAYGPQGAQPTGTTSVTLTVTTDEPSTCTYGANNVTGVAYPLANSMVDSSNVHTATLSGLVNGGSYSRAIRCARDSDSEANDTDVIAAFTVASGTVPTFRRMGAIPIINFQ